MKSKQPKFEKDETVFCYHGPHLYMAKCIDVKEDDGDFLYKIHYHGWNKTWDEFVDDGRVLKFNEENQELQKKLILMANIQKRKAKGLKPSKSSSKKKTKVDETIETEEEYMRNVEVKLIIPEELRRQLVDDWDNIINMHTLVPLPKKPNVAQILADYEEDKKSSKLSNDIVSEITAGLKIYFEHALGTLLLYEYERPQYIDHIQNYKNGDVTEVYGAEHLLRLFVKLPMLLAHTNMTSDSLENLVEQLTHFLKFLTKNHVTYFLKDYEPATDEYNKRVGKV
eukprot:CFRG6711T1